MAPGHNHAAPSGETTTASSSSKAQKPSSKPAVTKAVPAVAKIGTPVRDGKFEFTITSTKITQKVGGEYLNKTAQGQFLLVSVTVRNIGNEAQMFDSSSQKLFDTDGREYSADGGAGIYLRDANSFLNTINPGNVVKGIVVFDVPASTKLDRVEWHDSMFSGGVEVTLAK